MRYSPILAGLTVGGLLLAPYLASSQVTASGNGFLVRYRWTAGTTLNYRMTTATTLPAPPPAAGAKAAEPRRIEQTMNMSVRVQSVQDGIASVVYTIRPPQQGQQPAPQPMTETIRMDSRGPVGQVQGMSGAQLPRLPQNPIRVGGTWTEKTPVQSPMGSIEVTTTYTFRGLTGQGNQRVANFDITHSMSASGMTQRGTGRMVLNAANGMMTSLTLNIRGTITPPQGGAAQTITSTVNVRRV